MSDGVAANGGLVAREGTAPDGSHYVVFERAGARGTLYGVESLVVAHDAPAALQAQLDAAEGQAALAERPAFIPRGDTPRRLTQLDIGNTHHCNLACTYCYDELPAQKAKERDAWMTAATARTMVDALLEQCGAAPGASLVVSVDGPPRVHDRDRLFAGGRPSARVVLSNVRRFVARSTQPVRRVRAVSKGRQAQLALHQYLFDLGFNEIQVQVAYDEATTDGRNGVADLDALLGWYETLRLSGVTIAVEPYAGILERLLAGGESPSNHYPCGAGNTLAGITPDGAVVPCHHFVRDPAPPVGHVRDGLPPPARREALSLAVVEREPCRRCWARHVCGGERHHRALTAGRGYTGVLTDECDAKREVYARTIELFGRVQRRRPEVLRDVVERNLTELAPNPRAYDVEDLSSYG